VHKCQLKIQNDFSTFDDIRKPRYLNLITGGLPQLQWPLHFWGPGRQPIPENSRHCVRKVSQILAFNNAVLGQLHICRLALGYFSNKLLHTYKERATYISKKLLVVFTYFVIIRDGIPPNKAINKNKLYIFQHYLLPISTPFLRYTWSYPLCLISWH
jgi:hypothetical protein